MGQTIKVDHEQRGRRADLVVLEALPTISRAFIHKLFNSGQIMVNRTDTKPGYRLREGDELAINFDIAELEQIEEIDLPIIYQDDDVLVVDKPAGVISHARGKYWNEPSVASFVRQVTGQIGERAGIVHRLDRVTSGVMICAKNSNAMKQLQKQFSERKVNKIYYAIVSGHMRPDEAVIDMPIARNPAKPQTFKASNQGKAAQTHYLVDQVLDTYDVLRLKPATGRTHQLRVHLSEVGHPIVGDQLYGGQSAERLLLHAQSLELELPSGTRQTFVSPLPEVFSNFINRHKLP